MTDSHCHLCDEAFADDLDEVVGRAREAGLQHVMAILSAGNALEAARAHRLEQMWPGACFSIGVHPHHAQQFADQPERAADLVGEQIAATRSARAVGEIGLDYHYDFAPREVQQAVFRAQARLAREIRLPVVIHTREADDDTIRVLQEEGRGELRGVLHCFTGSSSLASAGLTLGFYISFAGIITFPKAADLRETARRLPVDRLLAETDSPFLAPVPYRGRRNEPAFVERVVATLAGLHGLSAADLGARATANFCDLFQP
jgi:TatD DNase family protein